MQNDRIHILDENIASRIAAGEVIINPASVVKELIENSIDANATSITVEIENGGKKYIRVTDNGIGMSENDIKICCLKHATSKISNINDLKGIKSLGFRGEALSAISAVSLFEIKSRQKESDYGAQVIINGVSEPKFNICGAPDGTTVKVKNLFFNLPARRKFLKSDAGESSGAASVVVNMIISNPDISFKYISNGKILYQSTGSGSMTEALRSVYGKELMNKLMPINIQNENISVEGFISRSAFQYKTKKYQLFILNGRYFNSKQISQAIQSGYNDYILKSHYPAAFLNIRESPENIDVNIHPAKTELLLYNEEYLKNIITAGISNLLANQSPENIADLIVENSCDKNQNNSLQDIPVIELNSADRLYLKNNKRLSTSVGTAYAKIDYSDRKKQKSDIYHIEQNDFFKCFSPKHENSSLRDKNNTTPEIKKSSEFDLPFKQYKIVGQVFNTYLLCEYGNTLYIIDQHAAHERLNFEKLKKQILSGNSLTQALLTPLIKKFTPDEYQLFEDNKNLLSEIGFDFEEFGCFTYRFSGLPVQTDPEDAACIIEDILIELKENNNNNIILKKENILKQACTKSIKAGDKLTDKEIEFLISEIQINKITPTCPHGRPIITAINKTDLEKGFKRII